MKPQRSIARVVTEDHRGVSFIERLSRFSTFSHRRSPLPFQLRRRCTSSTPTFLLSYETILLLPHHLLFPIELALLMPGLPTAIITQGGCQDKSLLCWFDGQPGTTSGSP